MAAEDDEAPRTELDEENEEMKMNLQIENDNDDDVVGTDDKNETTIVTQKPASPACSDLTDNNNDGDDQTPKTFPQKVSIITSHSLCHRSDRRVTVSLVSCDRKFYFAT